MLDFRIETFLCVCKHMNYTKAAEELNITQPGVSQHIKYLENYYGDKLFCYSNRELILTQTGIELRDAMISMKNDNMHLKKAILGRALERNTVRLGATLTIGEFIMPSKLTQYVRRNPKSQVDLMIANTRELLSLLEESNIDVAIVEGYFQKSEYEYLTVSKERYILVCGADYPLERITDLRDLFSHNLIAREAGSGTKEILERYLSDKGYSLSDFISTSTISSIHVIKYLVEQNCGISFLYETAVKTELQEGRLREIELPNGELYHEFNYIWRKNSVFRDYYRSLYNLLLKSN